ncbi:MAG: response regulator [Chloroflexi bacterium]|nr:response regulator [Chloroflexota bacterium]
MTGQVIAIVDDEPHMVDMIATFLQIKGFEVRGVYSGEDGLTMVQVEKPAALLLDLMLPDIEGYEVCARLRQMPDFATLPVIIVSARTDAASKQRAEQSGADAYLTKPVNFPLLMTELDRLLNRPAASAASPATAPTDPALSVAPPSPTPVPGPPPAPGQSTSLQPQPGQPKPEQSDESAQPDSPASDKKTRP